MFIVSSAVGFYRKPYSTLQNTRVFCQIYDHEFHVIELGRKQYSRIWKKPIPDLVPRGQNGTGSWFRIRTIDIFYSFSSRIRALVHNFRKFWSFKKYFHILDIKKKFFMLKKWLTMLYTG